MSSTIDAARRDVTISVVQFNARDDDKSGNVERACALLEQAGERGTDLAVLPEVWTGTALALGNSNELAEPIPGPVTERLAGIAARHSMMIVGSFYEAAFSRVYNTAPIIGRDGSIVTKYRKTHLFDPAERPDLPTYRESDKITPGESLCVVDTHFGRIGVAICSDIRFPEIFLTYARAGAELVILPSAFPARADHWEFLNRTRATDNQFFMVSSGMVGRLEHSPITFVGRSMVVDPWGVIVAQASDVEGLLTTTVDLNSVRVVRTWWDLNSQRRPELYDGAALQSSATT
ncbi:carbon-nitrogen hydrolase family protein [Enterovirga sp. CN4-39]|uniref:carbon-nitrogen hydrolase family protein n=1 Tax=Enterovirga sp. CN4-39 TaxID=3400910 RepID=UPI003C01579E